MATGLTPQLPLNFGGEGDFALIKVYEDLVKQNLKNLMLTIPGERTMDSNFGAGIQSKPLGIRQKNKPLGTRQRIVPILRERIMGIPRRMPV